jgi:outer membrane protein OmpA-like peptidoglycan-associated protein
MRAQTAFAAVLGAAILAMPGLRAQPLPFAVLEPWQTVEIEHGDRKNRLTRLSVGQGLPAPEFYEYSVSPERHGLADYPVALPVLRVVFRDRVFFDFDKEEVRPEAETVLKTIAASLQLEPPDVTVFIAGHTDAVGAANYNLQLGLRRSRAVARGLANAGIAMAQLYVVSFGEAVPVAGNDTEEGRARNRRVEFLFGARPEAIVSVLKEQNVVTCEADASAKGDNCPRDLRFTPELVQIATPDKPETGVPMPDTPVDVTFTRVRSPSI